MPKVHRYKTPVDITMETMSQYYVNLYDAKTGQFVEGRHYENFSGTAMMDEVLDLKRSGYRVEW